MSSKSDRLSGSIFAWMTLAAVLWGIDIVYKAIVAFYVEQVQLLEEDAILINFAILLGTLDPWLWFWRYYRHFSL